MSDRAHARRTLPALLLVCVGACGGGGGSSAPAGPPAIPADAVAEVEPNDEAPQALDLGRLQGEQVVTGTTQRVAVEGGLAAGDRDLVRFEAASAGRLVAVLDLPPGSDDDLALFAADGRRLATARADNRDGAVGPTERLFAEVEAGATYLVEVGGFAGATGEAYVLRLALSPVWDEAPVTPAATTTARVAGLTTVRSFHGLARLPDGTVLAGGGTRDPSSASAAMLGAIDTSERYDPGPGTGGPGAWSPGPGLAGARFGPSATALPSGRVLLAGGDLGGTADLVDPYAGPTALRIPLAAGMRALPTATLLPDGRVLLTGGTRVRFAPSPQAENLATTEVYDPKTRAFTPGPSLLHARTSHAAALLGDGRVLVTGGVGRSDTEIVDVRAGASSVVAGPALTSVRDDHTATVLRDGRILVLGGQDASGHSLDTAEILDDPLAGTGSAFRALAARMGSRRADHQVVVLPSGQVLVLGGEDDPGDGSGDAILTTVDLFQPATETFVAMPPLVVGRDDHRVVRLLDGRILVVGGEDATSTSIDAVEAYAPR